MKKNWKTSVFGGLMLAIAGFQVYSDPAQATNPQTMATIASGLGLLLAKDAGQAPAAPPEAK